MNDGTRIKASKRTFAIVERLITSDSAGVSELAEELDLPLATVHDHLTTLSQLGYVRREEQKYKPATKFLQIGEKVRRNRDIYETAKPELAKLSRTTRKQTSLMSEENGAGIPLINIETPDTVEVITPEGTPTPLHTTAAGKVILAYMSEERIYDIIGQPGPAPDRSDTVTDREGLLEELEQVRSKKFAVDRKDDLEGLKSVAAPVFDREKNRVAGAISIFGPNSNVHGPERTVLKDLHKTINTVERKL